MKICPYCKEQIRDEAIKCRYCQSSLAEGHGSAAHDAFAHVRKQVTYVLDHDLVRFGKFAVAVLAVFVVVGSYLFGFKLESSVERVSNLQKDAEAAAVELRATKEELHQSKATVEAMKSDVEALLQQAKLTLTDIAREKSAAVAMVVSIQELSPEQRMRLEQAKSTQPHLVRDDGKFWPAGTRIRIAFLDGDADQHEFVKRTAAEWLLHANLHFDFVEQGPSEVRITFDRNSGSWSFRGTDALGVAANQPTMNLSHADRRTVLHEFGHVLGLIEEHQNPQAVLQWNLAALERELSGPPHYWSKQEIASKVHGKVSLKELGRYRPFDPDSIMTFPFKSHLLAGKALGNSDQLSASDRQLVRRLYPHPDESRGTVASP